MTNHLDKTQILCYNSYSTKLMEPGVHQTMSKLTAADIQCALEIIQFILVILKTVGAITLPWGIIFIPAMVDVLITLLRCIHICIKN